MAPYLFVYKSLHVIIVSDSTLMNLVQKKFVANYNVKKIRTYLMSYYKIDFSYLCPFYLNEPKQNNLKLNFKPVYSTLVILILYDNSTFKQIAFCLIFFRLNLQRERDHFGFSRKKYTLLEHFQDKLLAEFMINFVIKLVT